MTRRRFHPPAVALVLIAALALGAGASAATSTSRSRTARAETAPEIVLLRANELRLRAADGSERVLVTSSPLSFFLSPVWSPDGSRIAYVDESLASTATSDWGSDIYVIDPSDPAPRLVWKHDQTAVHLQGIAWTPDGASLVIGYLRFIFTDGRFGGTERRIARLDLASGQLTPLIEGAISPSLSRDGSRLSYLTETEDGGGALWVANLDGTDARPLVELGAAFYYILSPRIAPDGRTVAFAAVDQPQIQMPKLVSGPAAHGAPMDVWAVDTDSAAVRRLTQLSADEPVPAWYPDSQRIAVLATGGLYEIDVTGGEPRRAGEGWFGGSLDIRPR